MKPTKKLHQTEEKLSTITEGVLKTFQLNSVKLKSVCCDCQVFIGEAIHFVGMLFIEETILVRMPRIPCNHLSICSWRESR